MLSPKIFNHIVCSLAIRSFWMVAADGKLRLSETLFGTYSFVIEICVMGGRYVAKCVNGHARADRKWPHSQ